jgi:pyrroloquinoline quinone biosynthesis protein B
VAWSYRIGFLKIQFLNLLPEGRDFIHITLLGTAAGGGLPQWNCSCANCRAARAGRIPVRTQSNFAVSADGRHWLLINASPDLCLQLERFQPMHPTLTPARNSRIDAVLLTNADLDHSLGIFLLRENGPVTVHATANVRATLNRELNMENIMALFGGIDWRELSEEWVVAPGSRNLRMRAIALQSNPPRFARRPPGGVHIVALQFHDERTGAKVLFAPGVAVVEPALREALENSDAVFFDGTFWSENELLGVEPGARSASALGHLPVSQSLPLLEGSGARRKVYVHINNTNPILLPGSTERSQVERAGILVGEDGMEFEL